MEKHPAVETTLTSCFYRRAGRGLTVGTSSKWLVTGGKRIHKLCRISLAQEPGASRPQCSCAGRLDLAFEMTVTPTSLKSLWGERSCSQFSSLRISSGAWSSLGVSDQPCSVELLDSPNSSLSQVFETPSSPCQWPSANSPLLGPSLGLLKPDCSRSFDQEYIWLKVSGSTSGVVTSTLWEVICVTAPGGRG